MKNVMERAWEIRKILEDIRHDLHEEIYEKLYAEELGEIEILEVVDDYPESIDIHYVRFTDGIVSWEEYANHETCETEGAEGSYEFCKDMEALKALASARIKEIMEADAEAQAEAEAEKAFLDEIYE